MPTPNITAVYSNSTFSNQLSTFSNAQDALNAAGVGNAVTIADDQDLSIPFLISQTKVTAFTNADGASFSLEAGVNEFYLGGDHTATIAASPTGARLHGNDADNILLGNEERDFLYGNDGSDFLSGGDADDLLYGGMGNDFLHSGAGRDKLYGGDGNDVLVSSDSSISRMTGGDGDDIFAINMSQSTNNIVFDLTAGDDTLVLYGSSTVNNMNDLLEYAHITENNGRVLIKTDETQIQLKNMTMDQFLDTDVVFASDDTVLDVSNLIDDYLAGSEPDFTDPDGPSGPGTDVVDTGTATTWDVGGVTYKIRAEEPLHDDFKFQNLDGDWFSPDYFVAVVAGQSNMLGGGSEGDLTLDPNVVAYDWVNDEVILADYEAAPAGGLGVRTGTAIKNNLFFPFANEAAAHLGQPVLVIAHPINGSKIDSWLANGEGKHAQVNWNNLEPEVVRALELVGQDNIDAFLWHQGEGDFSMDTSIYEQKFLALQDQIEGQPWGGPDVAFLAGELSHDGAKYFQNTTLQRIELTETDPNLEIVSSVGLIAQDESGVHFDGDSLVEFGKRYWDAYENVLAERADPGSTDTGNLAPTIKADATLPADIVMSEGDIIRIDASQYFEDAEGDALFYFGHVDHGGRYITNSDGNEIILAPDYNASGTYELTIEASDGELTSNTITLNLTVQEADPSVQAYSNRFFDNDQSAYFDLETAEADLKSNRGVDLLNQDAISATEVNVIDVEALHIRADNSIIGDFQLADGLQQGYFYGDADFDLVANSEDNYLRGNDGDNLIEGLAGRDRIYGDDGDDTLFGGEDDDKLYGDGGNDYLNGGSGSDQLYGGAGADIFNFSAGEGRVQVRDFSISEGDVIEVEGYEDIEDFSDLITETDQIYDATNDRITIRFDDQDLIVYNIDEDELDASLFSIF